VGNETLWILSSKRRREMGRIGLANWDLEGLMEDFAVVMPEVFR